MNKSNFFEQYETFQIDLSDHLKFISGQVAPNLSNNGKLTANDKIPIKIPFTIKYAPNLKPRAITLKNINSSIYDTPGYIVTLDFPGLFKSSSALIDNKVQNTEYNHEYLGNTQQISNNQYLNFYRLSGPRYDINTDGTVDNDPTNPPNTKSRQV